MNMPLSQMKQKFDLEQQATLLFEEQEIPYTGLFFIAIVCAQ